MIGKSEVEPTAELGGTEVGLEEVAYGEPKSMVRTKNSALCLLDYHCFSWSQVSSAFLHVVENTLV
jgi:hypothetical protein